MQIRKIVEHGITVLTLDGVMVEEDLAPLRQQVEESINAGILRVVLDVKQVSFIDSHCLAWLQTLASNLGKRNGDLRLASPNDVISDVLLATRVQNFVQVSEDCDEAVRSLL